MRFQKHLVVGGVALAFLSVSSVSFADEVKKATELFTQAKALYAKRDSKNMKPTQKAVKLLDSALKNLDKAKDTSSDLRYDVLVLLSRSHYWHAGRTTEKKPRLKTFEKAMGIANKAKKVNDDYAEAYYYYGIALARWAETKGVFASIGRKKELEENISEAVDRDTRDEELGETIDGYGPDRVFGRMFHKLPGLLGGSHEQSLKHLRIAVKNAPKYVINVAYLAETLLDGNKKEEKEGCQLLKDLLKKDPKTLDPNRIPEALEEFANAKKLYKKECEE